MYVWEHFGGHFERSRLKRNEFRSVFKLDVGLEIKNLCKCHRLVHFADTALGLSIILHNILVPCSIAELVTLVARKLFTWCKK